MKFGLVKVYDSDGYPRKGEVFGISTEDSYEDAYKFLLDQSRKAQNDQYLSDLIRREQEKLK